MRPPIDRPSLLWRAFVLLGFGTLKALSLSDVAWAWWEDNVTRSLSRRTVRSIWVGAVAVHGAEAVVANRRARQTGLDHVGSWTFTTLLYGFPVLKRIRTSAA